MTKIKRVAPPNIPTIEVYTKYPKNPVRIIPSWCPLPDKEVKESNNVG